MSKTYETEKKTLHDLLFCYSNGAMFTQNIFVKGKDIHYDILPQEFPEMYGDECYKLPRIEDIIRRDEYKKIIYDASFSKKTNVDGFFSKYANDNGYVLLDYSDFRNHKEKLNA